MATGLGGAVFYGPEGLAQFGRQIRSVGDVNNDGIADFAVSTLNAGNGFGNPDDSVDRVGITFVIYGRQGDYAAATDFAFDTGTQPDGALYSVFQGDIATGLLGEALNAAGDINGDGIDDIIIGSDRYDGTNGGAFVVYGQQGGLAPILEPGDLTTATGAALTGASGVQFSIIVDGIGDFNGDGFDDLYVGSQNDNLTYILFGDGNTLPASVDLTSDLAGRVHTFTNTDTRGEGIGDINGDGLGDILIRNGAGNGLTVIFGDATLTGGTTDLATFVPDGTDGFVMDFGGIWRATEAGDVNGDGLDDFIVLGYSSAHIVFGRTEGFAASFDPTTLDGTNGFSLAGGVSFNIGGVGDMNGDGIDDFVLADRNANTGRGLTYVVFGQSDPFSANVDVTTLDGSDGYRLTGTADYDNLGGGTLADVNNDGFADLITAAQRYDVPREGSFPIYDVGATFVVYGGPGRLAAFDAQDGVTDGALDLTLIGTSLTFDDSLSGVDLLGTVGADTLEGGARGDTLDGGDGNDVLRGKGGDDNLLGGDGVDTLVGGDGDDTLFGGTSEDDLRDVIYAGAGNDRIDGGYGNDELRGDAGNDTIAGGFGADTVIGGTGNDTLTGSAFADQIFGGDGNDFVNGGFGHDLLNGGAGADRFYHIGIADHGSDWVQDYDATEGDILQFGIASATRSQFQINTTHTATAAGERSGDDDTEEAFVIYRPTGQIMWALVDGAGQSSINLQIGGDVFDLLA
ncbi:FG-GAP-like repeat-containing protein [Shimia thalassica]|uniref:FG-GAP-like repeat-containing protein n=1 Tax=Shimia thalassica TaxID=1715693 RepID=UPI002732A57F|nr:FG-GAP-like repeat-containing protein [Shimia thalassica]MDP2493029.1 FG-GAP-like repeat-containing protein [Shimia thalassica]